MTNKQCGGCIKIKCDYQYFDNWFCGYYKKLIKNIAQCDKELFYQRPNCQKCGDGMQIIKIKKTQIQYDCKGCKEEKTVYAGGLNDC